MTSKSSAKIRRPKKMKLPKQEWDFTGCPRDQLTWCDVYEHLREDKEFIREVERMREVKSWSPSALQRFPSLNHAKMGLLFFTLFPEFPQAPFLSINPKARAERCRRLDVGRKAIVFRSTISTY